jgi:hypothetical protein
MTIMIKEIIRTVHISTKLDSLYIHIIKYVIENYNTAFNISITIWTLQFDLLHLGPVYRSEIKLIIIKCDINWTRDQIEPIVFVVNHPLKFNSN